MRAEASGSARLPPEAVVERARSLAYDRYLAALLAPGHARHDLVVLAAFMGEIERIPIFVREAAIAEIRLQWWRDALASPSDETGHPVADAVREMATRRSLPSGMLLGPVDGVAHELYEDGIRDAAELALYANETQGSALRVALAVLGVADSENQRVGDAAIALALTRLALTLPQHLALGRLPLPPDYSQAGDPRAAGPDEARSRTRVFLEALAQEANASLEKFRAVPTDAKTVPAFLTLALVAPYLASATRPGRDVLTELADISPLSRIARLWFASIRGRV